MADWIPWSDYYNIGFPSIDQQHKELFRHFNQVCDAVWDGKGRDSIGTFLNFLATYAVEHFGNEERHMQQHNYLGYLEHKKTHDALVAEVSAFILKYESEEVSSDIVVKVISDLGEWTCKHIRSMDQEMGRFFSTKL